MNAIIGNVMDCDTEENGGYPQVLHTRAHTFRADVGQDSGSTDSAPSPHDYFDAALPDLEALYRDVHAHPELSMQETRTAGLAAERLSAAGYEVTAGVGKTSVAGKFSRRRRAKPKPR